MNDEHSFVALFGLVLLAIAVAHLFKLSTILALLAAGIIVKNADERPQLWPTHFGTAGWLLTVILFALTLTSFEWRDIALGGVAALALIVARFVGKLVGVLIFAKPSGLELEAGRGARRRRSRRCRRSRICSSTTCTCFIRTTTRRCARSSCVRSSCCRSSAPFVVYRSLSAVGERRE